MMKKTGCKHRPVREVQVCKPDPYMKHDHDIDCRPYPGPKRVMETIVKCGMGISPGPLCVNNGDLVDAADVIADGECRPHCPVIATVSFDIHNLTDPTVKIDFSSIISFKACHGGSYFLRLSFKLSKVCDGGPPIPLGIWNFEKAVEEHPHKVTFPPPPPPPEKSSVQETNSFCFTWCQCEGCSGCRTYIVELVDQDCYNIDFATIGNIFITGTANGLKKY